ncbi:MAG: hypothetical protein A2309_01250 [Bacteroidetes bacterium RIFOXYB2_FULL_35_7]|nr:MAG: hypothetical protein A2X01_00260 [Bacteroidetes bacterium GWF2_35_48]OFY93664.1 MAG: hypothetical protein A2309_01250 [Bacteroidetes bacterium RIFOXYB2_FULL_35_7]OFZ01413.1 MAG: hypothetical protein A2491_19680 [Bacteroidetes bacterium RIFOXYC12_FULL_35_7]
MKKSDFILIEKYINNDMSLQKKAEFEARLLVEEDLARELRISMELDVFFKQCYTNIQLREMLKKYKTEWDDTISQQSH